MENLAQCAAFAANLADAVAMRDRPRLLGLLSSLREILATIDVDKLLANLRALVELLKNAGILADANVPATATAAMEAGASGFVLSEVESYCAEAVNGPAAQASVANLPKPAAQASAIDVAKLFALVKLLLELIAQFRAPLDSVLGAAAQSSAL